MNQEENKGLILDLDQKDTNNNSNDSSKDVLNNDSNNVSDTEKKENDKEKVQNESKQTKFNFSLNKTFSKFKGRKKATKETKVTNKEKAKVLQKYLNKEAIKKYIAQKENIPSCLSVLALVISVIALANINNGASSAFIESENELDVTSLETKKSPVQISIPNVNEESISQTILNNEELSKGLTFKDEEEFKLAVLNAINQIRADENKKLMEDKFALFASAYEAVPKGRKIYGNPEARFLIQEFSDLECPFCKEFFNTPKEVVDLSKNQVALEWIHTPLSFHEPIATQEAVASECVFEQKGNRAFWVALSHIFDTTEGNGRGSPELGKLVDLFNLDDGAYLTCINDPNIKKRIEDNSNIAVAHGIQGTPAVVITDNMTGQSKILSGAQPASAIMAAIEELNSQSAMIQEEYNSQEEPSVY